jgi:hypothetical protein
LNANECVSALDSLLDCLSSKPNEWNMIIL